MTISLDYYYADERNKLFMHAFMKLLISLTYIGLAFTYRLYSMSFLKFNVKSIFLKMTMSEVGKYQYGTESLLTKFLKLTLQKLVNPIYMLSKIILSYRLLLLLCPFSLSYFMNLIF